MVTIVTPIYNKLEFTKQFLESLARVDAGYDFEIVFVDNASDDGTLEFFKDSSNSDGVVGKYIRNNENKGFSIANNQGIMVANNSTEYYCFLNNDMVVTDNWLGALVDCMSSHEEAVIVGGKLVHPGRGTIQHAGIFENAADYSQHAYFGKSQDYKAANIEKKYFAVTGACMLVDKEFFHKIGGFDENYWCGWEDIDMCQMARRMGKEVWYTPESVIYHYEGVTEGRMIADNENFNLYMSRWILGSQSIN